MYIDPRVKYSLFLSDFTVKLDIFQHSVKNPQISNFVEIRPVGTELFHADGRI